ncbi:CHASE2 domain-containing protein [Paraburkholderia unamae]|uniref:CHASE2 domain-containing sensor protein n=1 Tax=Paraburkholderia unamae TaxID=219649 RepID=A0ABX5KEY0_9BURK|nr:CHASE2 domain-containing protein [Paraburkholderia unamae]PVX76430.1 CHASE2 domain-containing sensor protein [Paraburkholderia unamae]CAG9257107.1 Sensor protein Chase2 [Paraburkholderia unamae]
MKRYRDSFIAFMKRTMRAYRGRPWAVGVLVGLLLIDLCSQWPGNVARPAFLETLNELLPDTFGSARQLLFDHYQRRFPRIPATQPVTIVEIDDRTLEAVGQWPWPRNRLAHLVDAIAAARPLAIGLDIYMPEPDQTSPGMVADNLPDAEAALATQLRALPSHERILATSLRAAPSILGAAAFDHATSTTRTDMLSAPVLVHGGGALDNVRRFQYVLASLPELQGAAHGQAMLNVAQEQGTVRRIPLVLGLGDKIVPSLPIEMLRVATDSPAIEVFAKPSGVQAVGVADVRVPTQPDGDIWLHFASIAQTQHRYVSASDVLLGKVDPARMRNKLVLVGLTGTGLTDMRTTALGELVPGIEIQAQVIETIFEGRFLRRPAWLIWAETGFIMSFGLLLIWYVPRTDSRLAVFMRTVPKASTIVGLALNLLTLAVCFAVFQYFGFLVDAASIFIILSAVMGSFFTISIMETDKPDKPETARLPRTPTRSPTDTA